MWRESKLANMMCSGSLAPCFLNNNYVTAEIIHSTVHVHHKVYVTAQITYITAHAPQVLAWPWATLCCARISAPHRNQQHLLLHHSCVHWVSHERRKYRVSVFMAVCQPGERLCYGCCAIQRRINVSAVLTDPHILLQPLAHALATLCSVNSVNSEIQQDNLHYKQDEQQYNCHS